MSARKKHKKRPGPSKQALRSSEWRGADNTTSAQTHLPEARGSKDEETSSVSRQHHREHSASRQEGKHRNWRYGSNVKQEKYYHQDRNKSKHGRCEKSKSSPGPRGGATGDQTSTTASSGTSADDLEIPGFYFDKQKKKYFKIMPGHHTTKSVITKETIKKKEAEAKRQIYVQKTISSITMKKNVSASKRNSDAAGRTCCSNIPKYKGSTNICDLIDSTRFGHLPRMEFINKIQQTNFAFMRPTCHRKIFVGQTQQYEKLEHMCQMISSPNENKLLALWSLKGILMQRIQMLKVDSIGPSASSGTYKINMQPTGAVVLQSFSKVSNMCWAPMGDDPVDPDQTILYTTTCFIGNNPSLAMLRKLNVDCASEFRHTEFSLGSHATWTCAWNRYSKQFSVGSERCALLLDVQTRKLWELHTKKSDVLAQTFSQQGGNTLYNGTRKGHVLGHDMRSVSTRPALSFTHTTSISHLYVTHDNNYLVVADFGGKLKKWDLRTHRVVLDYKDQFNEYTRIPFHVDQQERILYSAGQDCYTRVWDFDSGRLLRTIAPPHPASRDTIPSLCYLEGTGNNTRPPGLAMGILDELHFYSL